MMMTLMACYGLMRDPHDGDPPCVAIPRAGNGSATGLTAECSEKPISTSVSGKLGSCVNPGTPRAVIAYAPTSAERGRPGKLSVKWTAVDTIVPDPGMGLFVVDAKSGELACAPPNKGNSLTVDLVANEGLTLVLAGASYGSYSKFRVDVAFTPSSTPTTTSASSCATGTSIFVNPGFESGSLSPWVTSGATISAAAAQSGTYAAQTNGNFFLEQTISPVPVSQLESASFWTWHNANDLPSLLVEWQYSDATKGSMTLTNAQLDGWKQIDLLAKLDPNKSLTKLKLWGYAGGGSYLDLARFDSVAFCRKLQ
jgi:hypothetical protein